MNSYPTARNFRFVTAAGQIPASDIAGCRFQDYFTCDVRTASDDEMRAGYRGFSIPGVEIAWDDLDNQPVPELVTASPEPVPPPRPPAAPPLVYMPPDALLAALRQAATAKAGTAYQHPLVTDLSGLEARLLTKGARA